MKTITIQVPDDCEVKIVKKEEEKKESMIRTYQDLINNKHTVEGFKICENSNIVPVFGIACMSDRNMASSEKIAKSMLAISMISQLMYYYGGAITEKEWQDRNVTKYIIYRKKNEIMFGRHSTLYNFLAFHKLEQMEEFMRYNQQLVKDYLMLD